ncbi:hypothetical protein F2P46_07865 [Massilia sp. CCM 8734]|nr:hypothetical protein [Massilia sp. CCM 8734]
MNSAPAELLQLLKFAALQLWSFLKTETTDTVFMVRCPHQEPTTVKEKAAMPEPDQAVRLCLLQKFKRISV